MTLTYLSSLMGPEVPNVGRLALPVDPWPASTPCPDVDAWFHADPSRTCLLVRDPDAPAKVGLIPRASFLLSMAGRFGFGRALLSRACVGELAQWEPSVLAAEATVQEAAAALLGREGQARYEDLVVQWPDETWGTLSAAAVLEGLAGSLAAQATTDSLTGLANRNRLLADLQVRSSIPAQGTHTALLFIDLDRFKQVNDVHGHSAGDQVLVAIGDRLRRVARPGDVIARLGGDEFVVMLAVGSRQGTEVDPAAVALGVAHRLLSSVLEPITVGSGSVSIGASIGVAVSGPGGSDSETLLREADMAMYAAKQAGGDRVHLVGPVGRQLDPSLTGPAASDALRLAAAGGELVLHYQPIWRLSEQGLVSSVEALVRSQHPDRGLLPPCDFLPAAEASGAIVEIDRWVLTQACRALTSWTADSSLVAPESINVNISRAHLWNPGLPEHVLQALADSGLEPHRLHLELSESATQEDLLRAAPALAAVRAAGVRLTLDDLGTGSSSVRHLSALPIDGIKIDRVFIRNMLSNKTDQAIVRHLVELGRDLGLEVTAEGIETAEQLEALKALGCTQGQGYLLGRPTPVDRAAPPTWLVRDGSARGSRDDLVGSLAEGPGSS